MSAHVGETSVENGQRTTAFHASGGSLLGDDVVDDALLNIASFLPPQGLARLEMTCPRFAAKVIKGPAPGAPGRTGLPLSLPAEAARRWVAACTEQERGWVHKDCQSWLHAMHEIQMLRVPLSFGRVDRTLFEVTEDEKEVKLLLNEDGALVRAPRSTQVMRSGRHFANFRMKLYMTSVCVGAMRPDFGEDGAEDEREGHCFYDTLDGLCEPNGRRWKGRMMATGEGDTVGMLLDLDRGSMTVYKNGTLLGVMRSEGLRGPLCWAVVAEFRGEAVRISNGPMPGPPTDDDLAAAHARADADDTSSDEDQLLDDWDSSSSDED
jgi:hypothetical protein